MFTEILEADIEAGDPVSQELWDKVRTNLNDLDDRVQLLESVSNKFDPLVVSVFDTHYYSSGRHVAYWRVPFDILLTQGRLVKVSAGSSGTLGFDVKRATSLGGSYTTVFSAIPQITSTSANQETTGTLSQTEIDEGDWLEFLVDSFQPTVDEFHFYLHYEGR